MKKRLLSLMKKQRLKQKPNLNKRQRKNLLKKIKVNNLRILMVRWMKMIQQILHKITTLTINMIITAVSQSCETACNLYTMVDIFFVQLVLSSYVLDNNKYCVVIARCE